MAGRLLGSAGGVMGAMALIKIFSATSKTGSTLAKVAGTLLNSGGGGSGKGSGQGKRSGGRGSSGEGSIAESMLAALKELKTNGAEGGNRRKPAGNARGQSGASAPAPVSDTVVDTTALGQESRESGLDADRQALATLAGNIASFVDGRVRIRHAGLSSPEAASALQTLLAANGLAASFSPRGSSVLLTYDAKQLDKPGFMLRALPLGRYLRDCDAALGRSEA